MERIIVNNVSKKFKIGVRGYHGVLSKSLSFISGKGAKKTIHALDNVSVNFNKGEIIGIIGKNGSGKSTLLRTIAGIYRQDSGIIKINGKLVSLISLNLGMKARLTMKDNIYLCGSLFGLSRKEIKKRINLIAKFAELEIFINTKLFQFSEGMKQRLAFSIAIHSNPDILLMDEVFEVGDREFKLRSAEKIKEIVKKGATVLLVSHELWMVEKHCDKVILMKHGRIIMEGSTMAVVKEYLRNNSKEK